MGVKRAAEAVTVLAVAALLLAPWPSAQQENTSCVPKLVICANDLNSTKKPSEKCCSSIKEAVDTQLSCLCSLLKDYNLTALIPNVTKALELPKRCGIDASTDLCDSMPSPAPTSGGGGSETPSGSSKDNKSGAPAITWIGTSGLMGLLVLSWSIVA